MNGSKQRVLIPIGAAAALWLVVVAAPGLARTDEGGETIAPLRELSADVASVAVELEGGESVSTNFVVDARSLEGGIITISPDLGDGRFLATIDSDHEGVERFSDSRLEWTCAGTECSLAATLRVDAFTDIVGDVFIHASGGALSGDLPADASIRTRTGDAVIGLAKAYELSYSFLEYPDSGDQAPHAGLDLIEYNLGDPSDEIELVIRPLLGNVALDDSSSLPVPTWADGLIPITRSTACSPDCRGSTVVRLGPSDFSNLEYQVIAYSERPGVGGTAAATRNVARAVTEIGFITMTPERPVAAIPITVSGDLSSSRIMADVGVRGRSSHVKLRAVGDASFEPATRWLAPLPGESQFELAISSPDTQSGDVRISWVVSLFTIPDTAAPATIEVGEAVAAQFTPGATGDPALFESLLTDADSGSGSGLLWGLLAVGVVGVGGFGIYRYRARS